MSENISETMNELGMGQNYLLDQYVKTLSEKELKAYYIAKSHLGSSFSLSKSKGFIEWKKQYVS